MTEYAERLDLPPAMYKYTPVPWIIELDEKGNFINIVQTSSGKKNDRGKLFAVPFPGSRTSNIKPNLLVDKAEYVLGIYKDSKTQERQHSFINLLKECVDATGEKDVKTVLDFLNGTDISELNLPQELTPDQWVGFSINGRYPWDLPPVQNFWASLFTPQQVEEQEKMNCIICGKPCIPVSPHPANIKGVPAGQSAGMAIISANSSVFESYGLKRSIIAPTCINCAEKYAAAANSLIQDSQTSIRIGPVIYLFWTRENSGFSVTSLLSSNPDPNEVKELVKSAQKGREYTSIDQSHFYATAFSASGARVAVRDWLETTVDNAKTNLARWFMLQKLVGWDGEEGEPYGLYPLCASLYRKPQREMVSNVPRELLKVALNGGMLPLWLLYQAMQRSKTERRVTRPRVMLIKMVLLSQLGREDIMQELDLENRDPAYLCGRLFAELEAIQKAAMPDANTTIVDRFYGTASTAPASVFGRLIRGAQNHLSKLRRDKPASYYALEEKLEEIQSKLTEYPRVLSLKEQGMFALGYYHQRAADRADARAAKENKQK